MLHAGLIVDLPSQLLEPTSRVRRLTQWLLGRNEDAEAGYEQLLLDNLTLIAGFIQAFGDATFDDVVSVVIDGRIAYVDPDESIGDLHEALEKTASSGTIDHAFSMLRITLSRLDPSGMRVVAELRARARVPEGEPEARIRIAAREPEVEPLAEEGPREYATRLREYIRDPARLDVHVEAMQRTAQLLAQSIPERLPGSKVEVERARVQLVVPGVRQIGRMRHLSFKQGRRPSHRNRPSYERIGAYDDPVTQHYFSPYQDLFDWIAVREVLAGQWDRDDVEVVHACGQLLFRGDEGRDFDPAGLGVPQDVIRVNGAGKLVVDASIPHVQGLDPVEAGSPHSPGWGGEQWNP